MVSIKEQKSNLAVVVGLALALVVLVVISVTANIQAPRISAHQQALEHVERARRLLAQYNAQMNLDESLRGVVPAESFKLESDALTALLETPELEEQGSVLLKEYSQLAEIKELPQAEQELLTLAYGPEKAGEQASQPPAQRVSGSAMISKGLSEYEAHLKKNEKLLTDALAEVELALTITAGDYSTNQLAVANRLKGIILYHQGLAQSRLATLMRKELADRRFVLLDLARMDLAVLADQKLVEQSGIAGRITQAQQLQSEVQEALTRQQATVAALQGQASELQTKLEAANGRAATAREAMETLQDVGVDLTDPNGFSTFRQSYEEQATQYRVALAEAHVLEFGTLANAVIDFTGDYLHGEYVPIIADRGIEFQTGLVHKQQELEIAQAELDKMTEAVARAEESVQSLKEHQRNLEDRVKIATDYDAQKRQQITETYASLKSYAETITPVEEKAISTLQKSASTFKTAVSGVSAEESESTDAAAKVAPERQAYHYSQVAGNQGWLKALLAAQQADAELRIAYVKVRQYQDMSDQARQLQPLAVVVPEVTADITAWQTATSELQAATQKDVETTIEALTRAHQALREGNWTIAAQLGAAHYLLAMLGEPMATEKALAWYDAALENRTDAEVAIDHVRMRDYIKRSGAIASSGEPTTDEPAADEATTPEPTTDEPVSDTPPVEPTAPENP
ncbi:MAG: hypothetical protein HJJLKODD_00814 [Phycisphaerae bacterium]|nr:hypothetical protein [Phycisphaerae bacterium]